MWANCLDITFFFILEKPSKLPEVFGGLLIFQILKLLCARNRLTIKAWISCWWFLRNLIIGNIRWIRHHWHFTHINLNKAITYFLENNPPSIIDLHGQLDLFIINKHWKFIRLNIFTPIFFDELHKVAGEDNLESCWPISPILLLNDNCIIAAARNGLNYFLITLSIGNEIKLFIISQTIFQDVYKQCSVSEIIWINIEWCSD